MILQEQHSHLGGGFEITFPMNHFQLCLQMANLANGLLCSMEHNHSALVVHVFSYTPFFELHNQADFLGMPCGAWSGTTGQTKGIE